MGLILGTGVGGGLIFNGKQLPVKAILPASLAICVCRLMVNHDGAGFPVTPLRLWSAWLIENYLSGRGFAWLYQHYYHHRCRLPKLLRFMIKAMSRQGAR